MRLLIGNKTYSSWSLRPWILMRELKIPFEEEIIPLRHPDTRDRVLKVSPTGKVPALVDGDVTVWESLAILEYLADKHPGRGIWPTDLKARALARSISSEMHAGFVALRSACPMNLMRRYQPKDRGADVKADVERITALWREARARFGSSGPFLFGAFSAADAMYAPVATRFRTYSIAIDPVSQAYADAVLSTSAFKSWQADALKETWILPTNEFDDPLIEDLRAKRS